jgi:hypothetical protein
MVITAKDRSMSPEYKVMKTCCSCGNPIEDFAKVYWHFYGLNNSAMSPKLALHYGCAGKLALHLSADALKAESLNDRHEVVA